MRSLLNILVCFNILISGIFGYTRDYQSNIDSKISLIKISCCKSNHNTVCCCSNSKDNCGCIQSSDKELPYKQLEKIYRNHNTLQIAKIKINDYIELPNFRFYITLMYQSSLRIIYKPQIILPLLN
jgi:hypothetical protein